MAPKKLNSESSNPEDVVRRYLNYLEDPSSVIDHDRVNDIQEQLSSTDDQIERLRLESELDRARSTDGEAIAQSFISVAKAFADSEHITAGAFRRQGVPSEVLSLAGFDVRAAKSTKAPTVRSQRVNAATVSTHVLGRSGEWTYNDIETTTGASIGTVRKVVDELVASNKVKSLGADPNHASRGRAPNLFTTA